MKIISHYGTAPVEAIQTEGTGLVEYLGSKKSKTVLITGALVCEAQFARSDSVTEYLELYTDEGDRLFSYNFADIDLFKKISALLCESDTLEVEIVKEGKYAKISEVKEEP